jgi:hypothetical protein
LKESKEGEEMGLALRRGPMLNASLVRNSSVEENVGRSTIFINLFLFATL